MQNGIIEFLEKYDYYKKNKKQKYFIIIDEKIPGEIKLEKIIKKINKNNIMIKIIIVKKENKKNKNNNNYKYLKNIYIIEYNKKIKINKIKKIIYQEKNKNIINIFGTENTDKKIFIINLSYYLSNKNKKILIIFLKIEKNKKIKNKINILKKNKKYKLKKIKNKIIFKNIFYSNYKKIIKLKKINENYDFIIIENTIEKIQENKNNSEKNIILLNPEIKEIKNIKNKIKNIKNIKIILNNYNKNSINKKIINEIFKTEKIIGNYNYNVIEKIKKIL